MDIYTVGKLRFLTLQMHGQPRVLSGSLSSVSFVDFITRLDFPFLYYLGHSCLAVIKNNLADLSYMTGNNKELHSNTNNAALSRCCSISYDSSNNATACFLHVGLSYLKYE